MMATMRGVGFGSVVFFNQRTMAPVSVGSAGMILFCASVWFRRLDAEVASEILLWGVGILQDATGFFDGWSMRRTARLNGLDGVIADGAMFSHHLDRWCVRGLTRLNGVFVGGGLIGSFELSLRSFEIFEVLVNVCHKAMSNDAGQVGTGVRKGFVIGLLGVLKVSRVVIERRFLRDLSVIPVVSSDGNVLRLLKILAECLLVKVKIERLEWCPILLSVIALSDRRLLTTGVKVTRRGLNVLHVILCLLHDF
jgi:hypothetical protein